LKIVLILFLEAFFNHILCNITMDFEMWVKLRAKARGFTAHSGKKIKWIVK